MEGQSSRGAKRASARTPKLSLRDARESESVPGVGNEPPPSPGLRRVSHLRQGSGWQATRPYGHGILSQWPSASLSPCRMARRSSRVLVGIVEGVRSHREMPGRSGWRFLGKMNGIGMTGGQPDLY